MKSAVQSEIIEFIQHEMTMSRNAGKSELVLVSGDIHEQISNCRCDRQLAQGVR